MKVGELRKLLEALTDDTDVIVTQESILVAGAGALHTHILGRDGLYRAEQVNGHPLEPASKYARTN